MAVLICEKMDDVNIIAESNETGKKKFYIEGIFLQSAIKNRNGRMYPESLMDREVARYTKDLIEQKRAYGELNHPTGPSINLDRVSHIIESLRKDGPNYVGKALVLETPMGLIAQTILNGGGRIGVSSRAIGSLKQNSDGVMEVQSDFKLATAADIVADPSAPDAFVNGIMENTEWVYNVAEGIWTRASITGVGDVIENTVNTIKNMSKSELLEKKFAILEHFVNKLANNQKL